MDTMKRSAVFVLLLLLPILAAPAQDATPPSVFVDTDPMGARILVDGRLLAVQTPALLRGLAPGPHRLSLWHEGFQSVERDMKVTAGAVPTVEVSLVPESVVLAFPDNAEVSDTGGTHPTDGHQFRYPAGSYRLVPEQAVHLDPVFPDEGLLTAAGWGLVVLAGSAAAATLSDAYHIRTGWVDHPSQLTAALWVSTLFELPWYGSLLGRKARFDRASVPSISPLPERLDRATVLFERGETALQAGDLASAEPLFGRLVRDYPESRLVPGAWFRLARIHLLAGRRDLALGEYRLVAETFPQAAYYDRARKAVADLEEAAGNPAGALDNLDRMVLTDGFFDPADIAAQKTRLAAAQDRVADTNPRPAASEAPAAPSPRQSFQRAQELFAQGHRFTAEEQTGLNDLRARLVDTGDADLAAQLDLLRMGSAAQVHAEELRNQAPALREQETEAWAQRERFQRDQGFWRTVRDVGLISFTTSTAASLLLAATNDRNDGYLHNGGYSDWAAKRAASDALNWALVGSATTMFFSLFPLLWGEARQ